MKQIILAIFVLAGLGISEQFASASSSSSPVSLCGSGHSNLIENVYAKRSKEDWEKFEAACFARCDGHFSSCVGSCPWIWYPYPAIYLPDANCLSDCDAIKSGCYSGCLSYEELAQERPAEK